MTTTDARENGATRAGRPLPFKVPPAWPITQNRRIREARLFQPRANIAGEGMEPSMELFFMVATAGAFLLVASVLRRVDQSVPANPPRENPDRLENA